MSNGHPVTWRANRYYNSLMKPIEIEWADFPPLLRSKDQPISFIVIVKFLSRPSKSNRYDFEFRDTTTRWLLSHELIGVKIDIIGMFVWWFCALNTIEFVLQYRSFFSLFFLPFSSVSFTWKLLLANTHTLSVCMCVLVSTCSHSLLFRSTDANCTLFPWFQWSACVSVWLHKTWKAVIHHQQQQQT